MAQRLGSSAGAWYSRMVETRPWLTAVTTGAVVVTCSDVTAQKLEGADEIDKRRLVTLAVYGGLYSGAAHKVLYAALERAVPQHWNRASRALSQVALSQFVHTPLIQLPVFYGWTGMARGYNLEKIKANLRDTYETTLLRNYMFWLPTTGLMYTMVPLHMRVLCMNSASYFWNTGLSLMTQSREEASSISVGFETGVELPQVQGLLSVALCSKSEDDKSKVDACVTIAPQPVISSAKEKKVAPDLSKRSPWPLL